MKRFRFYVLILVVGFLLNNCAGHVPKEVVELSTTVGDDINALHSSYLALIKTHFNSLRQQTDSFLKTRWIPTFLKDFIQRGNLSGIVRDSQTTVMDMQVTEWVSVALETIIDKRTQLMKPIDDEEKKLIEMVDSSFNMLTQANKTISSHLKSLSKLNKPIEGVNIYDLKNLREKISTSLSEATLKTTGLMEKNEKPEDSASQQPQQKEIQ